LSGTKINFDNKHSIITGGSSGIGLALAKLLVKGGSNITIIARNLEKLETAKTEINKEAKPHQRVIAISADVANKAEIEGGIKKAIAHLGNPHLLITSAGIAHPGYFQQLPLEIFEQTMAINYLGSLYSIKSVLPFMEQEKEGNIILISSGAGLIGIYGYTAYSPTKFALRGLGESLRGELKPKGIKIGIVYPPDTDTPQLFSENQTKPEETKIITGTAKTWNAEDVALTIIQGIEKGKFTITPGLEMTLLNRLHSLISPILNWYFDRIIAKISEK